MRHGNVVRTGVLSPVECQRVIDDGLGVPRHFENFVVGVRRCGIHWLYASDPRFGWLFEKLRPILDEINIASLGYDASTLPAFQFTDYQASEGGVYDGHIDLFTSTTRPLDRKVSFVVQLSWPSEYVGGKLELQTSDHPDPTDMSARGAMTVFPSWLSHCVTRVTAGRRFSLVGWLEGPPLR